MKKLNIFFILSLLLFFTACNNDLPPPPPEEIPDGFSFRPAQGNINADGPLTITFRAPAGHEMFGYDSDAFIHAGVTQYQQWIIVPTQWGIVNDDWRMEKIEENTWRMTLSPTIREWFNAGEVPVTQLGFVVRSANGNRQTRPDVFVNVTDDRFEGFTPDPVKFAPVPTGLLHGINIINSTTVTLVLYERGTDGARRDFAHVIGDFNDWTLSNTPRSQMFRDDDAGVWWITIDGLDPTTEYAFQYYIGFDGGAVLRVADPFARKVLDPRHDQWIPPGNYPGNLTFPEGAFGTVSVLQIQRPEFQWSSCSNNFVPPCLSTIVMYELLLRDFTARGDFRGAIDRLDYLQNLGINAIKLMPVQEFDGGHSWGYNTSFFFAIDKSYGGSYWFKRFVDESHRRGIAVILDVVYNHAAGANPWVRMWWDAERNRPAANSPYFNVVAPHQPWAWFYDFNHASPLVVDFVKRNLRFLLEEYRVDGFRFDFTKGFTNNRTTTDAQLSRWDQFRIDILKAYNSAILAVNPNAIVILEHFTEDAEEQELSRAGMLVWRNNNTAFSQAAMGWQERSDFSRAFHGNADNRNHPVNRLVSYMESHDEERMGFRQTQWGNGVLRTDLAARMNQLATTAAFFFTIPGPKMIWQFGELGYDFSINYCYGRGTISDGCRTDRMPIRWDFFNVPERRMLHDTYRRLIWLRRNHPELFAPDSRLEMRTGVADWANGRFLTLSSADGSKQVVLVGNFTNTSIDANTTFPRTGTWHNFMTLDAKNVTSTTMTVTVPANEFRMFTTFVPNIPD